MYPAHRPSNDPSFSQSAGAAACRPIRAGSTSLLLLLVVSTAQAADWPQWLGPNRDGSSVETVAPWNGPLKVVWRQPVGEGHSSPVVAAGKVFLHTRVADRDDEEVAGAPDVGVPQGKRRIPHADEGRHRGVVGASVPGSN